uniref:3-hydroxyisobutyrate dehydrogenase n=1 Tax=Romanomermis culicivorax TaxID=13658 RepID=A0A915JRH2_ROMCU
MGLAIPFTKKMTDSSTKLSQILIAITTGFCGSCTTFSAWQRDVSLLLWRWDFYRASNQLLTTFCASYCLFLFGVHCSIAICDRISDRKAASEETSSERDLEIGEFRLIIWLIFFPVTVAVWVFAVILPTERKLWFICIGLSPIGSNLRFIVSKFNSKFPHFPLFTFLVNIVGGFLATLIESIAENSTKNEIFDEKTYALWVSGGVATGILGSSLKMIGFIGLGNMGHLMCRNILKKGKKLLVYDISPVAIERLTKEGAQAAKSVADLTKQSRHVITIIPTPKDVLDIYTRSDGILANAKPGTLCADCSTIDPGTAKAVYDAAKAKSSSFLDAPVTGAVKGAEAGTLTFMCGGDKDAFEKIKETLQLMGKNFVYCGAPGTGQVAKICNNMLLAITMLATSEALNLGKSSGRSWTTEIYNPAPNVLPTAPSSKDYQPGFASALMTKDLGLAQMIATSSQSPTPLGSLTHQLYRIMIQNPNMREKDFSVVYKFLSEQMVNK